MRKQKPEDSLQPLRKRLDTFRFLSVSVCFLLFASCSMPRIIVLDDPLSPEEHINLGVAYQKNGEIDHAATEFKTASKKLPDAYLYLGNLYFENKDLKKAEKYYRKAISEKPDLGDAYNNLAWLYYTQKENLKEAQSLAEKAIKLNPESQAYQDTLDKITELRSSK